MTYETQFSAPRMNFSQVLINSKLKIKYFRQSPFKFQDVLTSITSQWHQTSSLTTYTPHYRHIRLAKKQFLAILTIFEDSFSIGRKNKLIFEWIFFVWKIRHKIKSLLGHTELNFCWFASGFLIKALCVEFRKKGDLDGVNAFHLQCTTKVALTCKFKSLLVFGCRVKFYYGELADRPAKQNHLIIALSLFYRVITTENIQQL